VVTKRIKRKRGKEHKYALENIHRKKAISKDTKAKAMDRLLNGDPTWARSIRAAFYAFLRVFIIF
jgi:hypothetical protein